MPTYDYVCQKCGHEFDQYQSIKDDPLKKCPKCKKQGLKRKIGGGAGLLFKGSGFYITDYRSEGYKKDAKSESGSSVTTKAEPAPASKTESKPAAKTGKK